MSNEHNDSGLFVLLKQIAILKYKCIEINGQKNWTNSCNMVY